ncbi:hypothetical protein ACQEVZ_30180 [Dactylosporangium sp. CA-152071]|uniref:hypothetical protein n=1 Tax=Dactylosporangium sp. CA-152071 TaxID=3239933 RepID=UPI003D8C75BD
MMDQEILTAIAVALATGAAEGLAGGGRAAFEALAQLVRRAFQGRASAHAALADAEANPADETRIGTLQQALTEAVAEDPAFETDLQAVWRDLSPHLTAGYGGVANNVSGTIEGNVVQARDVHGGISFGTPGRTES